MTTMELQSTNILITSIGSMSGEYAISSLRRANFGKLYGCDLYPSTYLPHSRQLDGFFQVPRGASETYEEAVAKIVKKYNINVIVPLTDVEVDFWTNHRDDWEKRGIRICIASNSAIQLCRDKYALAHFPMKRHTFSVIPTYREKQEIKFIRGRIIAKPRKGRSSEGIFIFEDSNEIPDRLFAIDYLFQPYINGNIFTVDYLRTAKGNDFGIAREELLRTANGAGTVVRIVKNEDLINAAHCLGEKLNLIGCVNMEFIHLKGVWYLLDINPRFSAGVSFSFRSGYDFVSNHIRVFLDKAPEKFPHIIPEGRIFVKRFHDQE